jgi:chromosome segregation ATPase
MDIEVMKFGFQVLEFLLTGGIAIYVYMSNKDRVTNDRIEKLEDDLDEKLDKQGERIATLEAKSEGTPTHDDLSHLHEKINAVNASISTLAGEFSGVRNLLNTIHHHLLSNGGRQ